MYITLLLFPTCRDFVQWCTDYSNVLFMYVYVPIFQAKSSVPYKSFVGNGSNGSAVKEEESKDSISKPSFFLSDECEVTKRSSATSQKNTKL